jgi:hypothetical protein
VGRDARVPFDWQVASVGVALLLAASALVCARSRTDAAGRLLTLLLTTPRMHECTSGQTNVSLVRFSRVRFPCALACLLLCPVP